MATGLPGDPVAPTIFKGAQKEFPYLVSEQWLEIKVLEIPDSMVCLQFDVTKRHRARYFRGWSGIGGRIATRQHNFHDAR